jgi:hypothetical protein
MPHRDLLLRNVRFQSARGIAPAFLLFLVAATASAAPMRAGDLPDRAVRREHRIGAPATDAVTTADGPASARRRSVRNPPRLGPACSTVLGTPAVTFSVDGGRSVAPTMERLNGVGYTYGLVTLDIPDRLLAVHKNTLISSSDAGCSWSAIAEFSSAVYSPPVLEATSGGRAYGWSPNNAFLFRVSGTTVNILTAPVTHIAGFRADAHDGRHVRLAGADGSIWESFDEGTTWNAIGRVPLEQSFTALYTVAFDPADLNHVLAGTSSTGAFVSRDGGTSWTRATGLSTGGPVNVFTIAISPVDGNVVWAMALDIRESDLNVPSHGRHIHRSTDGGQTFTTVVDADPANDITLTNGPILIPHPTRPELVYFTFGSTIPGVGAFLYTYDDSRRALDVHRHLQWHGINSIAFSRNAADVMYLGLQIVQRVEPRP